MEKYLEKTESAFKSGWTAAWGGSEIRFKDPANCVVQVKVTQTTEAHKVPQTINTLQKGDYFGEKALIR